MPAISPADAEFVRELVYRKAAITLDCDKAYLIESRLQRLVHEGAVDSVADLVSRARRGQPKADLQIVEALATHETLFFRDLEPFEVLKKELLPARLAKGPLTVWSAACSSGQEPYSLAMLLCEHFKPAVEAGAVKIIATDLSTQVLEKAKAARFRQLEVNRGLPSAYLVKYFERAGADWMVKEPVRKLVEFRQLNLAEPWNLAAQPDLVLMRNVLIYFDARTKFEILDRVRRQIGADGVLMLGAAETTLNIHEGWERVPTGKTAYYRPTRAGGARP